MACVFCGKFKAGTMDFESAHFGAALDIHPVSPGHMLVIPKRHIEFADDLDHSEWNELRFMISLTKDFVEGSLKNKLLKRYQEIAEVQITPNSVWFCQYAVGRPWFGKKPDGYNVFVNEGEVAGQTVEHLHYHVVPRYRGDMADPSGGGRYVIPGLGNYRDPRPLKAG